MEDQGRVAKRHGLESRLAKLSPSKRALLKTLVSGGRNALAPGLDAPYVASGVGAGPSPLVEIQPGTRGRNFFGLHALSGTVTIYTNVARSMGEGQPFYALQSKGIVVEDEPHTCLKTMAAYYLEAVREMQPEGPYMLGGYSLGGHIAYEMAQQLRAEGSSVGLLALLDSPRDAFNFNWGGEIDDALYWCWRFKPHVALSVEQLRRLSLEAQVAYVIQRLRLAEDKPPFMHMPDASVRRVLLVEKSNCHALFNYRHEPYHGPITLLTAAHGPASKGPHDMGWSSLAAGGLEVHVVPGDHESMIESPHVEATGRLLLDCIARGAETAT